MAAITIARVTSAQAHLLEAFLQADLGPEAAREFQASRTPADWLASEEVYALLARYGEAPAGAAVVVRIPKADARRGFLYVDELTVLPAFHRRGVALALLAHVEALARSLGLAGVRLLVRPDNEAARRLYARAGYTESASVFCEKRAGA